MSKIAIDIVIAICVFIVATQLKPINLERIYSIGLVFVVLSIFLADSYLDFKKKDI